MQGKLKVAAAHVSSVFMNAAETTDKAVQWVEKAAADGADLLVFPETFIPGFPVSHTWCRANVQCTKNLVALCLQIFINCYAPPVQAGLIRKYQDQSVEIDGPELGKVQAAAQQCKYVSKHPPQQSLAENVCYKHPCHAYWCASHLDSLQYRLCCQFSWLVYRIAVVIGVSERSKGGRTCYNSSVAYDKDGSLLGVHRKILPTYAERYVWGQGDGSGLLAWNSSIGKLGSLICWEHTMNLARYVSSCMLLPSRELTTSSVAGCMFYCPLYRIADTASYMCSIFMFNFMCLMYLCQVSMVAIATEHLRRAF